MSNNKQIEKPLELPHQETIVGTNTIQTKPFDNQKEMSNNKQSSIEWLVEQIKKDINLRLRGFDIYKALEQAEAMRKDEIKNAQMDMFIHLNNLPYGLEYLEKRQSAEDFSQQYYNETFGGNNE